MDVSLDIGNFSALGDFRVATELETWKSQGI